MFQKFNKYFLNKKNDKLVKEISTKYLSSINDIGIQLKSSLPKNLLRSLITLKKGTRAQQNSLTLIFVRHAPSSGKFRTGQFLLDIMIVK